MANTTALIDRKAFLFQELTELNDKAKSNIDVVDAEVLLGSLTGLENDYRQIVAEVLTVNADITEVKHKVPVKDFAGFQALITSIRKFCFKAKLSDTNVAPQASTSSSKPVKGISLPKLSLKAFSGDIGAWNGWKSQYDAMVHSNKNLSDVEKLIYLRSILQDEPLSIVNNYELIAASYATAYNDLTTRYSNPRLLASYYMKRLFDFKSSSQPQGKFNINYLDVHKSATAGLKQLSVTDLSDFLLFEIAYRNLHLNQQKQFDKDHDYTKLPTLSDLMAFVENLARTDELHAESATKKSTNCNPKRQTLIGTTDGSTSKYTCPHCKGEHRLYRCTTFEELPIPEKKTVVKQFKVCTKCLSWHKGSCKSKFACKHCQSDRHHTFLCDSNSAPAPSSQEGQQTLVVRTDNIPVNAVLSETLNCNSAVSGKPSSIILGTIKALIADVWGNFHSARIVCDPGSEISIITTSFAKRLGLRRSQPTFDICGIAGMRSKPSGSVNLLIKSVCEPTYQLRCNALVLHSMCNDLPSKDLPAKIPLGLQTAQLADPEFYKKAPVDILLGSGEFASILSDVAPTVLKGNPTAVRTYFGYVLVGQVPASRVQPVVSLLVKSVPLDTALRQFWEVEEVAEQAVSNPDDDYCENHFISTHSQNANGKYVVRLPFRPDSQPLGNNRAYAFKSLERLQGRFQRKPDLEARYTEVFEDYWHQDHMTRATEQVDYVLPHSCVFKESSTTSLRVIFDASAKDNLGLSINDRLYSGPTLYSDVQLLLLSFRLHEVVLQTDIKQMFRNIEVHPDDRKYQHVLWKPKLSETVDEYALNTLVFGFTSSPYLAQRVLRQLVVDHGKPYPKASKALLHHTWMDDVASGGASIQECLELRDELVSLLNKGGFALRKWSSSHSEVLKGLPEEHKEVPFQFSDGSEGVKVLGLSWERSTDSYRYRVKSFDETNVTKRTVLSYIARIWDCLGLLSAVTVKAKIFLQKLWLEKIDWNDKLSDHLTNKWLRFIAEMNLLSEIRIARKISVANATVRLVGFADASEMAMAANVYLHTTYADGSVSSNLVLAKTKVAPLKTKTIPRLELEAAVLLTKIVQVVRQVDVQITSVHLFSDSQIVLTWLRQMPHTLKIYVANRVIQIHDKVPEALWAHVPSHLNPADLGSRGLDPSELLHSELWWHGPQFLSSTVDHWPKSAVTLESSQIPEMKTISVLHTSKDPPDDGPTDNDDDDDDVNIVNTPLMVAFIQKFSSFAKLKRVMAYVLRFIHNVTHKTDQKKGFLESAELKNAELTCVKIIQNHEFPAVITALQKGRELSSYFRKCTPFLDGQQLLRAGGRIKKANCIAEEAKHPLLLPKTSHLSLLICDHYHLKHLHAGPRLTQSVVRQKYWIFSLLQLVKKRVSACQRCFRLSAKAHQPIMGELPSARVNISRPFASTATDFAGPVMVKESTLRRSPHFKSYVCAFVCLSTKAVHLEMVMDMTAASFLGAFYRFVSRRGLPGEVISDQGRNFLGARRILEDAFRMLDSDKNYICTKTAEMGVNWKFSPAYAPNFNGLIEAVVKSAKRLLIRQIGKEVLPIEHFQTILARVEATLNSRPLTPLSEDPNENVSVLTPAHFLVGSSLFVPAEIPVDDLRPRDRWHSVQRISQTFWKHWSRNYIHTLLERQKWNKNVPNIAVGQIVLIRDIASTPLQWPLGRVTAVHCGRDNVVRVATVRCQKGEIRRSVNKLVLLPM